MDHQYRKWLSLLEDVQVSFEEKRKISNLIANKAGCRELEDVHIPLFYQVMVKFWRSLGVRSIDRRNETLFPIRKDLAGVCWQLSLQLPGEPRFFKYFPRIGNVEGPNPFKRNEILSGSIRNAPGWLSIYEFHWEYPINGFGVRKDLISAVLENGMKIPLLDWCEKNDVIVYCNRCGLDITYDVSRNCPWIKKKVSEKSHS